LGFALPTGDFNFRATLDNQVSPGLKAMARDASTTGKAIQSSLQNALTPTRMPSLSGLSTQFKLAKYTAGDFAKVVREAGSAAASAEGGNNKLSNAVKKVNKEHDQIISDAPRLRYALYDVSSTTGVLATALLGAATAATVMSAKFESAFTDVERTTMATDAQLANMRMQLEGLARDIPLAFADITTIAALGAQLGVATGDLAGFAETVAQFAATTNVSAETAAQSFGAIGELLNISADEFVNLGSAIAFAGVNSVATETEILSVTTAIAAIGSQAGLSNNYIGGLSTSLASLRVPAEQSRGALTRTFQEINRAAADGGQSLSDFAAVAGMTAEEMQALIQTEGGMDKYFTTFLQGLEGMDATQLTSTLDALNLSDIRVTNTLTRLSQNMDVVSDSMENFSTGFENGTFLAAAYAKRVEDLAAKFTIFQNSLAELGASLGDSLAPLVGGVLEWLTVQIQNLTDALGTEAGQNVAKLALGLLAITGTLLGLITAIGIAAASVSAFKTVVSTLGLDAATGGLRAAAGGFLGVAGASGAAATAMRVFKLALIGTGIGLAVIALGSLVEAFTAAGESAEIQFNKFVGSTAGLLDAVQADTAAYQEAVAAGNTTVADSFTEVDRAVSGNKDQFDEQTQVAVNAATVLGIDVVDGLNKATDAAKLNTVAIGENTFAWFRNQLMQSEAFRNIIGSDKFIKQWEQMGISFSAATAIAATQGEAGVLEYFQRQANATKNGASVVIDTWQAFWGALGEIISAPFQPGADIMKGVDTGAIWDKHFANVGNVVLSDDMKTAATTIGGLGNAVQLFGFDAATAGDATAGLGSDLDGMGNSADDAAEKIRTLEDYANDLSSVFDRSFDLSFGVDVATDDLDAAWRTVQKDIEDAQKKVIDLQDDIVSLNEDILDSADGFAESARKVEEINQKIRETQSDINSLTADKKLKEYFLGVANAYGDTLRAQQLQADITAIDSNIAGKILDQAEANADLADEAKAVVKLQAELVKKEKELVQKNKELVAAQDANTRSLTGNSEAAANNRRALEGIIQANQDLLIGYAASGMSQAQLAIESDKLKQQFIQQAAQLGFNQTEVQKYTDKFDGLKKIIETVPRNVTVGLDINVGAAELALREFDAKMREQAGKKYGGGSVTPSVDAAAAERAGQRAAFLATAAEWNALARPENTPGKPFAYNMRAGQIASTFYGKAAGMNWAEGGYTGAGGKYEVAGIVHRGEYVIPKQDVNQVTGLPYFMSQVPKFFNGGNAGGGAAAESPRVMTVELSPYDRKLLAEAGNVQLRLDGRVVAEVTNTNNFVSAQRGSN
jgi:TP901 family phage tail tape measure protein